MRHNATQVGRLAAITIASALLAGTVAFAQALSPTHAELTYAVVDDEPLALDLYLPQGVANPPLVVWVHGGAWRFGSRAQVRMELVEAGFAIASVDFRQSGQAPFPAQVHDIKAAIRFLRAMAPEYGYRDDHIAIVGVSSGGHLAALVGVTNGHAELEGSVGGYRDHSSDVAAIVSYFGPTNLTTILAQSTPFGLNIREPAVGQLLGASPEDSPELARLASPVLQVSSSAPPVLMLHGDQDPQVPINQAHELVGAYNEHGGEAHLVVLHGAAHGGDVFFTGEQLERTVSFLRSALDR